MQRTVLSALCLLGLAATIPARGDDWPQWLGPRRDATWREPGLVTSLPAQGLPVKWRVPVKGGYSGPAVADGRVYLADYDVRAGDLENAPNDRTLLEGSERVLCLEAATGRLLWKHDYDCPYSISYAAGPRCTPTVADGKVYVLGAEGNLACLDARTGAVAWKKDFKQDYGAPTPIWGFCGHPLVEGDLVICLVGGEGSVAVAFDRNTGVERWRALTASETGYCPPTIIEAGGRRQLVIWDADNLNALDPGTGAVLWSQPLKPMYGMSIMAPQVADTPQGRVLFASGIGRVGALFALPPDQPAPKILWRGEPKSAVYCANSTPFIAGDTLYGCDCDTGALTAVALADGRRLWESLAPTTGGARRGKHGTAFLVRQAQPVADDPPGTTRTWIFSETGDLVLARLSPEQYEELGRMHLLDPTNECFGREVVWSHPAFAGGCIFARNDRELVCVSATAEILLDSPRDHAVIQRSARGDAVVRLAGTLPDEAGDSAIAVEARLVRAGRETPWRRIDAAVNGRDVTGTLVAPAGGWWTLEVRMPLGDGTFATGSVAHVGIGEVFVVAGQSNSANHGEERQRPTTGRVATFDGAAWRLANDPQPGASGGGGSFLPAFGDAVVESQDVPVGIVACGIGATSVREWLPQGAVFPNPPTLTGRVVQRPDGTWASNGAAFDAFVARMKPFGPGGFRAVLWHQGESDANQTDPARTLPGPLYREYLETLIRESRRAIGWDPPWFVAQASYHVPGDEGSDDIRAAQAALWKDAVALEGPDSDALKGPLRERGGKGVHFSGAGLREHGAKWAEKVIPWLDRRPTEPRP